MTMKEIMDELDRKQDAEHVCVCEHCIKGAKFPEVKHYQSGAAYYKVSRAIDGKCLAYDEMDFNADDNVSGYYCGSCGRELTVEEVYDIFEIEVV